MPNRWIVGHNVPGYLPEAENDECETWEEARGCLLDRIERAYDDTWMVFPLDRRVDVIEGEYSQVLRRVKSAEPNSYICVDFQRLTYWLTYEMNEPSELNTPATGNPVVGDPTVDPSDTWTIKENDS